MPKAAKESLQALMLQHGLKFTKIDGKLDICPSIDFGLPPKMATLVFVAKIKPDGSVGRGPPEGFNLQTAMELSNAHYKVLMDAAWIILQRTPKVDTNKSFTQQQAGVMNVCIKKLLRVHDELDEYKRFGNWAPRATFQLLLRNKSGQANSAVKRMEKLAALVASGGVLPESETKPRKPRGKPRKNPVPEGTTTTTNEPAAPIQPQLTPDPIAAAPRDDDGEVFDLNVGDSDDLDTSMHSAINDLSKISINSEAFDNDEGEGEGEDDGGSFDMAQVAPVPASAPAPTPKAVPVLTRPAVPSASPVSATPAGSSVLPVPVPPTADASTTPPALPASAASAAPPATPAPAASSTPSPTPVSVSPANAASATGSVRTVPLTGSPDSAPASIIWRGITISPNVVTNIKKAAAGRAAGRKGRCAKIYEDLIQKLIEDPDYDPSSEPDPVPQVAAKTATPKAKAKAVPTPEPGLELNADAGKAKAKGKATAKPTDAPVRRSGRETRPIKW